jgi:hypothetical protein
MNIIVSSSPGRIRVRDKALRDQARLNRLEQELMTIAAIKGLQGNVRTGSLLLRFDQNAIDTADMEAGINAAADKVIGKPVARKALLSKKNINRYNKLVMLASLGTSLVLIRLRRRRWRRWHALAGYLFVANLGIHLFIYRKSLLRLFR